MINFKDEMLAFKVGDFVLHFPNSINFKTFNNPNDNYGVKFFHEKMEYEVLDCKLGTRLLINGPEYGWKDIPFHMGTSELLPNYVKTNKHVSD